MSDNNLITAGADALRGLYMRMCDAIRAHALTDAEVHGALDGVFPDPRISELLRVAGAPEDIYRRYRAGFFGFRTALDRCRFYTVTPSARLRQKKIQRTAARLVALLDGHRANLRTAGALVEVIPIGGELIRLASLAVRCFIDFTQCP